MQSKHFTDEISTAELLPINGKVKAIIDGQGGDKDDDP